MNRPIERNINNIAERKFLGNLLRIFKAPTRITTIDWAQTNRMMSSAESSISGRFDCSRTPAFEYLYNLCDNWYIHIVGCMKSSQVGASEMENNVIGKVQDTAPCNTAVFFPGTSLLKEYSRKRFKPFFQSCEVLRNKVNIDVAKPSHDFFTFPGGSLALRTLGSIQSVLSSPFPFIILEEFAQVKAEVAKQGDPLGLVIGRQKSFNIGMKKVIGFSTPTFKDFCNMEKLYEKGFQLIFKAQCHCCHNLIELSGWTMDDIIVYQEYQDRYIDETYGQYDPDTARFACPSCKEEWSFDQKTQNIVAGKNFGFIDDCGDFSFGWHPRKEEREIISIEEYRLREPDIDKNGLKRKLKEDKISLIYTLQYPEILSCFEATSDARLLATKKIVAELALTKGDETLLKDWYNNSKGLPYSSGTTMLEASEMITLRKNYPEHICPMEGLVLTAGVDVQHNRFAIVIRAWGRNGNSWLVTWKEIFGDTRVQELSEDRTRFLGVWGELSDYLVTGTIPHAGGKQMPISGISIDSGDNTENVYRWVLAMQTYNQQIFATKGVRDMRYNDSEIYQEPPRMDGDTEKQTRKSLYETMGVTLYTLNAHRAHTEILSRINLNKNKDARSNIYFFNEQSYGQYEEQMTSCRKMISDGEFAKEVYKLIPGKRKEAMDAEKNALHAAIAIGVRNYSYDYWRAIEQWLYN